MCYDDCRSGRGEPGSEQPPVSVHPTGGCLLPIQFYRNFPISSVQGGSLMSTELAIIFTVLSLLGVVIYQLSSLSMVGSDE